MALLALAVVGACSSSSAPEDSPSGAGQFPLASDGSIITPSGFVFKGRFAICNQAKCEKKPGSDEVSCACDEMKDTWTLSPVPAASLKGLSSDTRLLSTFTTANLDGVKGLSCSEGEWADCYGAICEEDSKTGEITCDCPLVAQGAGHWFKYVKDCAEVSPKLGLVGPKG